MPVFTRTYVLYREEPEPGHYYWWISARPSDDGSCFVVSMAGGETIQAEPDFKADNPDAEYYSFSTAEAANKYADDERDRRILEGWKPFLSDKGSPD